MPYLACFFIMLCTFVNMTNAQEQPRLSPAQQEVLDARQARMEAGKKRDGSWARYVAKVSRKISNLDLLACAAKLS